MAYPNASRVLLRFVLILAAMGCAGILPRGASAAPIVLERLNASVNSSLVLLSDVAQFRRNLGLRLQLDPLFAQSSLAQKAGTATDGEITEMLIDDRLISQQFPVADTEVEQEINTIQANNHIDRSQLKAAIQEQGYTFDDYFDLIRLSIARRNLIDRDIRTKVSISDDDVKNYFYNHFSKSAAANLSYKVKIITFSAGSYKNAAALQEAANRALESLKAGEAFEEVAKRMSDDLSASSGGDLGTLTEDQMSPQIRNELKKLEVGQVSGLLGSPKSRLFILKLADINSNEDTRFQKMKEEIRGQLAAAEYDHQIRLWLERQRQTAFIHRAGEPSVPGLKR